MATLVMLALAAGRVAASGSPATTSSGTTAAGTAVVAPASGAVFRTLVRSRFLMGTPLVIETRADDPERAIAAAFDEVARLEEALSNWRASSEVSRMNRDAAHAPVKTGPELCSVVGRALDWAEASGGAFDPTVEPLVRSLGLRGDEGRLPGQPAPPPTGGPAPVGWRGVRFDRETCTVRFAAEGMGIDLGGIGKGYALDAAAETLRRAGATAARLDFGGQVLVFGRGPDDGGWRIGVADPRDRDRPALAVVLRSGSISTSGDGERSVAGPDGAPVGHLLDPATRRPIAWEGSVTVRAGNATDADALSTALFVMGPDRGLAWAAGRHLDVLYLAPGSDGGLDRRACGPLFRTEADRPTSSGGSTGEGADRGRDNPTHPGDYEP